MVTKQVLRKWPGQIFPTLYGRQQISLRVFRRIIGLVAQGSAPPLARGEGWPARYENNFFKGLP